MFDRVQDSILNFRNHCNYKSETGSYHKNRILKIKKELSSNETLHFENFDIFQFSFWFNPHCQQKRVSSYQFFINC